MVPAATAETLRDLLELEPNQTCSFVGGTFHTARVLGEGDWFLRDSTERASVIPADVEIGDPETLAAAYPDAAEAVHAIAAIGCAIAREPSP